MPVLTSYSPYETLLFFQNVAQHGVDGSSLQEISTTLNQNELIRQSSDYDAEKFSPDALQFLYNKTVGARNDDAPVKTNGDGASDNANPLKRKLSTSPPRNLKDDPEYIVQQFVERLYAQFRSETIRDLQQQEREYEQLQHEISKLEDQAKVDVDQAQAQTRAVQPHEQARPSSAHIDGPDPVSAQLQASLEAINDVPKSSVAALEEPTKQSSSGPAFADQALPSPIPIQRSVSRPGSGAGTPLPPPAQPQAVLQATATPHQSPGAFNRTLPPPSPQRNNYGPIPPPPHTYPPHHQQAQAQPPMISPIHSLQRMPSHEGYPPQRSSSQGRGSPMPPHASYPQQPYPRYPPHQQPPPYGWPSHPPPQPYPQQYPPVQHYPPPVPNRYPPVQVHTPNQPPYQQYPNTAPIPYPGPQQYRGSPAPPYHQYAASASTTPMPPRPLSRAALIRSASSTPWKRRSTPMGFRPRSPSRLEREVSPLSDHESPAPESPNRGVGRPSMQEGAPPKKSLPRDKSVTPAANLSRSQSVVSTVSEIPEPPKRRPGRPPKVKVEGPSTPVPTNSDADSEQQQRSSGRRGRPRAGSATNPPELARTGTVSKRKREAPSVSPVPHARPSTNVQPSSVVRNNTQHSDRNFVVISRTFGKTSQLLLNEITSHKRGNIFAKPLSERDAPGYKQLVHRPQDLKSIKAAISKGSRVALTAIEELEAKTEVEDGAAHNGTSTPVAKDMLVAGSGDVKEGALGNGFYLVRATEDLMPPKGIVNSSQLELELIRMFANAIMFNPLPASERGFGRSLRLRKRGGELRSYGARALKEDHDGDVDVEDETEHEASEPVRGTSTSESESTTPSAIDETGIIADTREMLKDVEELVRRWRELEGDSTSGTPWQQQTIVGPAGIERHASVSASSIAGEEENEGTPTLGSMRKRRKVGDH
ncbi:hypothetical protein LTS08_004070 [Lithohypha guttulata]|uniref:Bromo domain-containing protein n=1 Tax=Lithohypha guttulata TaxID=1690604 RepID=A0AAN7T288_9EURO|nr:hypothetical protein LTR51_005627 [Lithohypha guttulata]KAK5086622.1 hypothetical protein LTR05_003790 [Lithohypha guttulata]KAK5101612.1 hypothetical protein LTS08_004070 [Lithohypha guttulata]